MYHLLEQYLLSACTTPSCLFLQEIYKDRKKFSKSVFDAASTDLVDLGLLVVSFTLKDISDDKAYLRSLGEAYKAQVHRRVISCLWNLLRHSPGFRGFCNECPES